MSRYDCLPQVITEFQRDRVEVFRPLLPEPQWAVAVIHTVTCTALPFWKHVSVDIRFTGVRLRDGQPYARPVHHYAHVTDPEWFPYCFPNREILRAARALIAEAGGAV